MPIYFYWGDDEFRLSQAVADLCDRTLAADWASFNFDKLGPETPDAPLQALNQAMTPPFGLGQRLVWLQDTALGQRCPEAVLQELERTLPQVPESTVLLFTSRNKPDGRAKFTKLLQRHGELRQFATIPPWKREQLAQQVTQMAQKIGLSLSPEATTALTTAIGNDTRQLWNELQKLAIYWQPSTQPLPAAVVHDLVTASSQNSLQLAQALGQGQTSRALTLVNDLLNRNEPALRIVAVLVSQFRTWLWVKLLTEAGERDARTIAQAAERWAILSAFTFCKKRYRFSPWLP
ncbi:DNA polymerase III subunit delta [Halomicronema hongdechloris C2206]|uniref:DNA polymerase III subunit delta n=1 Tax=Halomicronema hongdechloris C2206 TaxID=1641165 RepID=A0A1Z3HMN1_9CYAN|nr:DNA polymerase III subunit delta [Halomicronema hongdechloris]ASC71550.1 DNA polymerase III subunit delta [Halomicronema hongdechloris C2206]